MNVHKNAKLTPAGRALLVERVLTQRQRWAVVAVGFGVSKRTVGKWVRRWQAEGNVGLRESVESAAPLPTAGARRGGAADRAAAAPPAHGA